MNCQAPRQLIQDSLDGNLPQASQAQLLAHLAICEPCSRDLESLQRAVSALEALPRITAPPELLQCLAPQLDQLALRTPLLKRVPARAIAAGFLVASVAGLAWFGTIPSEPDMVAMEPPSAQEILEWVDASADPAEILPF